MFGLAWYSPNIKVLINELEFVLLGSESLVWHSHHHAGVKRVVDHGVIHIVSAATGGLSAMLLLHHLLVLHLHGPVLLHLLMVLSLSWHLLGHGQRV